MSNELKNLCQASKIMYSQENIYESLLELIEDFSILKNYDSARSVAISYKAITDDLSGFKEMLAIIDAFQVVLIPD